MTLIYSIAILGMFMTLVLSIFFLITPKGNKNENRILAALIMKELDCIIHLDLLNIRLTIKRARVCGCILNTLSTFIKKMNFLMS